MGFPADLTTRIPNLVASERFVEWEHNDLGLRIQFASVEIAKNESLENNVNVYEKKLSFSGSQSSGVRGRCRRAIFVPLNLWVSSSRPTVR